MYRLQILYNRRWRWGIKTYNTAEEAEKRVNELAKVGIKSRCKEEKELFDKKDVT